MKALKYYLSAILLITTFWSCTNTEDFGNTGFVSTAVAPSNISALFNVTQDNTGLVTITPNGEGAISYEVVFGDNSDSATVKQGGSVQHTYAEGSYDVKITATGITGLKAEVTKPLVVSFKAPENLVVTIENDLAISKQVNVTANADFATSFDVYFGEDGNDTPVSANIGDTASYVYAEPGTYTIRVVAKGGAIQSTEYTADFDVTAILQPIASAPAPTANAADVISIFSDAYTNVAGTDYFPDWGQGGQGSSWAMFDLNGDSMLQYINLSYQGIQFGSSVDATSLEYLHIDVWTPDVTGIDIYPIDGNGAAEKFVHKDLVANEWNSFNIPLTDFTDQGLPLDNLIQFKFVASNWAAGTVFLDNIYFYNSTPTAPATAAPTPINNPSDVISIYSDAYTNVALSEVNPNWGQTTTLTDELIEGNNTWLYENLDFTGIVTDYGNPTNLSTMTYVHFDYWTPDATSLGLKLVNTTYGDGDPLKEDIKFVGAITTGTWVGVDIPLADYTTDLSAITQILFDTSGNSAKIYIDNLYFYKEGSGGTALALPLDFETAPVTADFINFDGGTATVIDNPQSGSAKVAQIVRDGGATWAGSKLVLNNYLDFSTLGSISMKVFTMAPVGTTVKLKLEDSGSTQATEVDALTTVSGAWETLTWDFTGASANTYDTLVFMFDFGNVGDGSASSTFLFDDVMQIDQTGGKSQIDLPVDFESATVDYTLTDFGGNQSSLIVDPNDASNMIVKTIKGVDAATWAGTTIGTDAGFATNIPITLTNSKMTVRVWSPAAGTPIRLKIEDANDNTHTCETETNTTVASGWEIMVFDFANEAPGTAKLSDGLNNGWVYNKASIFFNFGTDGATAGEQTYYFDDVLFGNN